MTEWTRVWSTPGERLFVERQPDGDIVRHRFRSNEPGDGSVILAHADDRILFLEIYRPVLGITLLELPRGQAEADDGGPEATGARELLEESGFRLTHARSLGRVWPDSGLSGDGVHVVLATGLVPPLPGDPLPEFTTQRWLSQEEISTAVRSAELRDAISLAALSLLDAGL